MRLVVSAVTGALIGFAVFAVGTANADPAPPGPTTTATSTSDDLADMVMEVIDQGAAPTATPVPAPPG